MLRGMTQAQAARVFSASQRGEPLDQTLPGGGFPGLGRLRGLQHGLVADQPRSEFEDAGSAGPGSSSLARWPFSTVEARCPLAPQAGLHISNAGDRCL